MARSRSPRARAATPGGAACAGGSAALSAALHVHLLTETARLFAAPIPLGRALDKLAGLFAGSLHVDAVLLLMREREGGAFRLLAGRGVPRGAGRAAGVPAADPLAAAIARSRRPLLVTSPARDPRWRLSRLRQLCPRGARGVMALPLGMGATVDGLLVLVPAAGAPACTQADVEWFLPVAEQVSFAVEKTLLNLRLEEAGRSLEATVRERTRELREANRALARTVGEVRALRHASERIIASLASSLVTFDAAGKVVTVNPPARAALQLGDGPVEARDLAGLFGEPFAAGLLKRLERPRVHITRAQAAITLGSGEERFIGYSVTPLATGCRDRSWILLFRDLTDSRRLENDLRRLDRLVSLGEISANVAHELKNPLTVMYANMEWLLAKAPVECHRRIQITIDHMERMERIIQRMGTLSREQPLEARSIDFGVLVSQMLSFVDKTLREKQIDVALAAPSRELWMQGDPAQLQQVLLNLIMNASQAIGAKGRLTVRLQRRSASGRPGLELAVADSGPGIPAHLLKRVFEPFFTTKDTGTGLGLAITSQIVQAHHGRIRAENLPEGGACITVWLPLSQPPEKGR